MAGIQLKKLTLQFIPFSEIESLDTGERIKKLLGIVLTNRIILLQGKLKSEEEARLIEDTMAIIGHVQNFKGIELAVLSPKEQSDIPLFSQIKKRIAKALVGDRDSITVIGPASVVREIKRDPSKIELLLQKR
jgi:hypothetical protein